MISSELQKVHQKRVDFDNSKSSIVYLNIGGTHFQTFEYTLTKYDSIFRQILLLKDPTLLYDKHGRIFFDRSPKPFGLILKTLQNEETEVKLGGEYCNQLKLDMETEIHYYGFQNSLTVKPFVPPEPPEPTIKEKFFEFKERLKQNISNLTLSDIAQYIYQNKDYLIEVIVGSMIFYLILFTVLLSLFSVGYIRIEILFWPFYGISISFLGIKCINYINDRYSAYHNIGSYIFGIALNAGVTYSSSIFFAKVYYWYHDFEYYSWCLVNILPILLSLLVMLIALFHITNYIFQNFKKLNQELTIENIAIYSIFFNMFWTIFSLNMYMDGYYFNRITPLLFPLLLHVVLGIICGRKYYNKGVLSYNEEIFIPALIRLGYGFIWMVISSLCGFYSPFSVFPFTIMSILLLKSISDLE